MKLSKYLIFGAVFVGASIVATQALSGSHKNSSEDPIVLSSRNTLVLADEVNDQTVSKVMYEAATLDRQLAKGQPMYLVLDTPGGSIQSGLDLISFLNGLEHKVTTVTMFAASMGFQIAQGLHGERLILETGTLMSHRARGGFQGQFPNGEAESRFRFWIGRMHEMDQKTVARSNGKLTLEKYTALYQNELWADGHDSVALGIADRIVAVRCDNSLLGKKTEHANFMGIDIAITLSSCPLIRGPLEVSANFISITDFNLRTAVNDKVTQLKSKTFPPAPVDYK